MKVIRTRNFLFDKDTALSIGNFDGLHTGHRRLIASLMDEAVKAGLEPGILTFDPHPMRFFSPYSDFKTLFTADEKINAIRETGVAFCVSHPFDAVTAGMNAEDFVRQVIMSRLRARLLVVGSEFRFGAGGKGDVALMRDMADDCGFRLLEVNHIIGRDDQKVSTTSIKDLILNKKMELAKQYLTRPYSVAGTVCENALRVITGKILPPSGYYQVKINAETKALNGSVFVDDGVIYLNYADNDRQPFSGHDSVIDEGTHVVIEFT